MFNPENIRDLQFSTEKQILDRKSARISPKDLSAAVTAMANADGGYLVIGIEDDGTITGIDNFEKNVNELQRVSYDYCIPSVQTDNDVINVIDCKGRKNHILRIRIYPSSFLVATQADEVSLRVGDKNKKMNFEQRLQLFYAKGMRYYEDESVYNAALEDIDLDYVSEYCRKIGFEKGDAEYFLRHNSNFIRTVDGKDKISGAAILLFGNNPQIFFPRARIRFIRYEGTTAEVGEKMNVVKDVKFTGRILEQVRDCAAFVKTQIREYTKLGRDAVFITEPEYPEFCWTELIVNAAAHRDYSIKGTDIQIKMFDDHFQVESPGILSGPVRISNIREFHFSRNPKIAEFLNEYDLVKEFGEGIDRIFRDMKAAGLPEPVFVQKEFMFYATLRNRCFGKNNISCLLTPQVNKKITPQDNEKNTPQDKMRNFPINKGKFASQARQFTPQDNGEITPQDNEEITPQDNGKNTPQDSSQILPQDYEQKPSEENHPMLTRTAKKVLQYCTEPRSRKDIMAYLGLSDRKYLNTQVLRPLIHSGKLLMTIPEKPNSRNQRYITKKD